MKLIYCCTRTKYGKVLKVLITVLIQTGTSLQPRFIYSHCFCLLFKSYCEEDDFITSTSESLKTEHLEFTSNKHTIST